MPGSWGGGPAEAGFCELCRYVHSTPCWQNSCQCLCPIPPPQPEGASPMTAFFKREPALIIAGIMSVLTVAVVFGLPLTGEQQDAIETALWAIVPLIIVTGAITRQSVVAPANVAVREDTKTGQLVAGDALESVPNGKVVTVAPVDWDLTDQ